jgi:hypothetical protein
MPLALFTPLHACQHSAFKAHMQHEERPLVSERSGFGGHFDFAQGSLLLDRR